MFTKLTDEIKLILDAELNGSSTLVSDYLRTPFKDQSSPLKLEVTLTTTTLQKAKMHLNDLQMRNE